MDEDRFDVIIDKLDLIIARLDKLDARDDDNRCDARNELGYQCLMHFHVDDVHEFPRWQHGDFPT